MGRLHLFAVVLTGALLAACAGRALAVDPAKLKLLTLPPGFEIAIYADGVQEARSLALGANGTVFVGSREAGNVYALVDRDGDQRAEQKYTLARGLRMPNGVAFRDGALYVAEIHRVLRYDGIESHLGDPPAPVVVNDSFPRDRWHGWKFIRFGPDGRLYVPVGAPCNVCLREDERYSSIMRMQPDGRELEVFAHGVRNTVGFDWHPVTKELWFTDNGRDELGDDSPPDELNHAPQPGLHFGFPFVHAREVRDPEYGGQAPATPLVPPVQELTAHCAALGMRFYTGTLFPAEYRQQVFIAEQGSWNRYKLPPSGYRVSLVRLEGTKAVRYEPFVAGWLQGREAWGRPVDVQVMPDGALLVSDDRADAVYRISYRK